MLPAAASRPLLLLRGARVGDVGKAGQAHTRMLQRRAAATRLIGCRWTRSPLVVAAAATTLCLSRSSAVATSSGPAPPLSSAKAMASLAGERSASACDATAASAPPHTIQVDLVSDTL
jgi:hypothetical protein